ncbi:MAG: nicotinamide riboside transporter PnuC [Mycoplasmataceae bacterium]|jgi:nicotinamide mononucleotide transporter|nr:nicotinamide riboside transporter PnuC [Mycoplasmataceae bacterium]
MISGNKNLQPKKREWKKILFFTEWPLLCQILLLVNFLAATGIFIYQMIVPDSANTNAIGSLSKTNTEYMIICLSYGANIINAACLILAAIRKISNYYWGIIACVLLGTIAYFASNTGSWITYWAIQVPMQIIGIVMWRKNSSNKDTVEPANLKWYWYIIGSLILLTAIGLFAWLESYHGFSKIWYPPDTWKPNQWSQYITDSAVLMLDIAAVILMIRRYKEQWILWALLDITGIVLWSITLNPILIVMFTMALISCVYGIWDWWIKPALKLKKKSVCTG